MTRARFPQLLAAVAVLAGVAAWVTFAREGLVLSHYDARAHLVVARRVIDSLTPGWQQLGAVWLPLPHLIQLLPSQIDLFYRTGAFASATSIVAFAVTVWAAASLVLRATASRLGAATAAALLVLNPNLLYLQSTPMTEPLLLAVTFVAVLWLYDWVSLTESHPAAAGHAPVKLGWALVAAAWTRYEAWPIIAAGLVAAGFAMWRRGDPPATVLARIARVVAWPAAAVLLFLLNSRLTVGAWFVSGGFYEIDPLYDGRPWRSLVAVWWGTHQLSGYVLESVALITAAGLTIRALGRRDAATLLVPLALFAAAALPFYGFYQGHPYRVRYMVPAMAACLLFCGIAVGLLSRVVAIRTAHLQGMVLAALLIASSLIESPPLSTRAPLIEEAQWDLPRSRERRAVTACLAPHYRGEKVMASMGSLAHYMQELAEERFAIADFLHEGNGTLWELALETGPAPHVGWMLLEEQSEGGDVLTRRVREHPEFARGMVRVCEGGGVALYKRE